MVHLVDLVDDLLADESLTCAVTQGWNGCNEFIDIFVYVLFKIL